jgi:hypothetical protein
VIDRGRISWTAQSDNRDNAFPVARAPDCSAPASNGRKTRRTTGTQIILINLSLFDLDCMFGSQRPSRENAHSPRGWFRIRRRATRLPQAASRYLPASCVHLGSGRTNQYGSSKSCGPPGHPATRPIPAGHMLFVNEPQKYRPLCRQQESYTMENHWRDVRHRRLPEQNG